MSHSEAVWCWRASSPDQVDKLARAWLTSDALDQLMSALGGPAAGATAADKQAWTAANLDTRGGGERRDAPHVTWHPGWSEALLGSAAALGLIATPPAALSFYHAALVLGGATTGNRLRVALTRELVEGGVDFGTIVGLTADRELSASELRSEPDAKGDGSEARNLLRYLDQAYGPLHSVSARAGRDHRESTISWQDERYAGAGGRRVRLLVTPGSSGRRATTADAVRFYGQRTQGKASGSILVITSSIYAPYQFFTIAPALLARAGNVELVGTTTVQDDPTILAQRVAQEIHAGVDAATRLVSIGQPQTPRPAL